MWTFILGKSRVPLPQLICKNLINADAHMTVTIGFIIRIWMAERFNYGYVASNGRAMIVKINGHVRWILQKVN